MPIDIENCPALTLFTSTETAKLLRLSSASVRRFALDGRLRAVPGVRKLLFTAEAVRAFLRGETLPFPAGAPGHGGETENNPPASPR
jgi:hypothetical protein